jgi:hypothetical protein
LAMEGNGECVRNQIIRLGALHIYSSPTNVGLSNACRNP